jgi:hypothetical protein
MFCQLCKEDWNDYLVTAEYLWHKFQPLSYESPYTHRTGKVGLTDDLETVIKKGIKSQELITLLQPLVQEKK